MGSSAQQAQVAELARQLKLPTFADTDHITRELMDGATLREILIALMERELAQRLDNRARRLIRAAGFPFHKTPDELDLRFYAGQLSAAMLAELGSCAFVAQHRNLIISGGTGLGKTHLAIGLGLRTCARGQSVLFCTARSLVTQLQEARDAREPGRLWQKLQRCALLIIDEPGYVRFDREEAELLYQVMAERAERGSIILTTNLAFSAWTQCFADTALLEAMLDRLCHNAVRLELHGPSWRLSHEQRAGA